MLEIRSYTYAELSQMLGTRDAQGICRRLTRWDVAYTVSGRRAQTIYDIIEIPDPFKVFCILDLGFSPQTDFDKLMFFLYYALNDDEFLWLPYGRLEVLMGENGRPVSRQTISHYFKQMERCDIFCRVGDYCHYFANGETIRKATKEEYSRAWAEYWMMKEQGYWPWQCIAVMRRNYGGIAKKQRIAEINGIYMNIVDNINDMVCQRIQKYLSKDG